jgi:hypothetical protein
MILQGWLVANYAVTTDAEMVGVDSRSLTFEKDHVSRHALHGDHPYKYHYNGFGRIRYGQSVRVLKPNTRRIGPDDIVASGSAYHGSIYEPAWKITLRESLVRYLASVMR